MDFQNFQIEIEKILFVLERFLLMPLHRQAEYCLTNKDFTFVQLGLGLS